VLLQEGIAPALLEVTSHGEANPLVPTADEVPEPRNRRVEVMVR
jgi:outer membrane protein OmpA-like peptidoglycan-associated protein